MSTAFRLSVSSFLIASASFGQSYSASALVDARTVVRQIPSTIFGTNAEWVYSGYGIWDAAHAQPDPALLKLTQDLKPTLIRYPGGFFADYYHWANTVGPVAGRLPQMHYPEGPSSVPYFGADEALQFADAAGAKLIITVNVVTGTALEAAEWVRRTNAVVPSRVPYWEIGNENYGSDGSVAGKISKISPEIYAERFLEFSREMRKVDPTIKIGAIGGLNDGNYSILQYPEWNSVVIPRIAGEVDFISVHNAYYPFVVGARNPDVSQVYRALLAAPARVRQNLADLSLQLDRLSPSKPISIAVTEWGPFYDIDFQNPMFDHNKTMASALYAASTLKVFCESPKLTLANSFKLFDNLFMGWIGLRGSVPTPKATYLVSQLFRSYLETQLVNSSVVSPKIDTQAAGIMPAMVAVPQLEMISSLSADRQTLSIIVINKDLGKSAQTTVSLLGFSARSSATVLAMTAAAPDAHPGTGMPVVPGFSFAPQAAYSPGGRIALGGPGEVQTRSSTIAVGPASFSYIFPRHSVTAIRLKAR
jgi:alpha-L-arabinofuranosidase